MGLVEVIQYLYGATGQYKLPFVLPTTISVTATLIACAIYGWVEVDRAADQLANPQICLPPLFQPPPLVCDFVVVGAGSAGMTLAARISNNTKGFSVCLLEAGGEPSPLNAMPLLEGNLHYQTPNNWIYRSVRQNSACIDCDNQQIFTTRGKMLGGSSSTNFNMAVRGNAADYDDIANMVGDQIWNYNNCLPYFKKMEDYHGNWENASDMATYHGQGGLLNINKYDYQPGGDQFLAAAQELGYKLGDYNGADQLVFSYIDATLKDGKRESTYRAYYEDTGKSSNLKIIKYAHVTKVNIENGRAIGVTYDRHNCTNLRIIANKEVIVSAGVFNSPQILMLSGIGPAQELAKFGIPVIKDLPVGQNLRDQPFVSAGVFVKDPCLNSGELGPTDATTWVTNGSGPLGAPAGLTAVGFLMSPNASSPNLQIVQGSLFYDDDLPRTVHDSTGMNETLLRQYWDRYKGMCLRFPALILGKPLSVGSLTINSTNPYDPVVWDAKYLTVPADMDALVYGSQEVIRLYENTTALNAPMITNHMPGCEAFADLRSVDYLACVARMSAKSLFHHVGTCSMGKVVDTRLKVIGVPGLRVVDASIFPNLINGNTHIPTVMVSEKASDFIKTEYQM